MTENTYRDSNSVNSAKYGDISPVNPHEDMFLIQGQFLLRAHCDIKLKI